MDLFLQQSANGLVLGGAYVLVALGLYLIFSAMHIPNFAHGEMFALGAFLQYALMRAGLPFFLGMLVVIAAVGLVGACLERLVFRRLQTVSTVAVLVGSLALAIVVQELLMLAFGKDPLAVSAPFDGRVDLGPIVISSYRLFIIAMVLVASAGIGLLVHRTVYGRKLRALAQNKEVAQLTGINTSLIGTATFALGSALAGFAGALLAPTTSIHPHMGFQPTLIAFVVLVVVGAGGRMNTVIACGFLVAVVETLAAGYISNTARQIVIFAGLVVFLAVRPEGAVQQASSTKVRL
ncbi:branched-chain amino acid ABC transporter permease [Nocardioides campestrisoli]|uniref:branched-chain amino acid ABC transporter permease n=1 Tax=Nocardioides campestrisoli TaxID=2736757 RepID=UPI00163DD5D3|nr:branched-chain amino acid ABC transporter permease [Nocardioides campestrisoli]